MYYNRHSESYLCNSQPQGISVQIRKKRVVL